MARDTDNPFLLAKISECYDMAKRMQYKLFEYQKSRESYLVSVLNDDGTYTITEVE